MVKLTQETLIIELNFTAHAEDMLKERNIALEWVERTIAEPMRTERNEDGTVHYLKPIREHGGRVLRVVTRQEGESPMIIVTLFFDRREWRNI
ncbi:MAG: DUF4258 domain-containing protein [Chloroflexi bacterium]|nr:DUF4258 domain-containing protein [Chloroflexota bacterium]